MAYRVLDKFQLGYRVELLLEPGFHRNYVQNHQPLVATFYDARNSYMIDCFNRELELLKEIQKQQVKDLPILMDFGGFQGKFKFIITNSHGPTLEQVFRDSNRRFKKVDVLKMGIQLVKIIEKVHDVGYLHGDIRPSNIVISQQTKHVKKLNQTALQFIEEEYNDNRQRMDLNMQPKDVYLRYMQQKWHSADIFLINFTKTTKFENNGTHLPE